MKAISKLSWNLYKSAHRSAFYTLGPGEISRLNTRHTKMFLKSHNGKNMSLVQKSQLAFPVRLPGATHPFYSHSDRLFQEMKDTETGCDIVNNTYHK